MWLADHLSNVSGQPGGVGELPRLARRYRTPAKAGPQNSTIRVASKSVIAITAAGGGFSDLSSHYSLTSHAPFRPRRTASIHHWSHRPFSQRRISRLYSYTA